MTNQELAQAEFEAITHTTYDATNKQHEACVQMMVEYKNGIDKDSCLDAISTNGESQTFKADYPQNVMRLLSRLTKRVRFL